MVMGLGSRHLCGLVPIGPEEATHGGGPKQVLAHWRGPMWIEDWATKAHKLHLGTILSIRESSALHHRPKDGHSHQVPTKTNTKLVHRGE